MIKNKLTENESLRNKYDSNYCTKCHMDTVHYNNGCVLCCNQNKKGNDVFIFMLNSIILNLLSNKNKKKT